MLKAVKPSLGIGGWVKCAFALALLTSPVQAQELQCAPSAIARAVMEQQGARLFVRGVIGNSVMEIWALADGSEFKLFSVKDGMLCHIADGSDLRVIAVPGQGA